jgi:hypothetical protein
VNLGLVHDEPYATYAAVDAINVSSLKEIARSGKHYQYRRAHPKSSGPLTLGTATHTAILEPERFAREYVVWDAKTDSGRSAPRNGKRWDAFRATYAGKSILLPDEYERAMAMRDAVARHPAAMRYLAAGRPEVSMYWHDAEHERPCRGRLDWLASDEGPVLVGLKSARDCRGVGFGNAAARLGYHLQWAFYGDGFELAAGVAPRKIVEIVVESFAPFDVAVFVIPVEVLSAGRDEYRRLLGVLADYERSGNWSGVADVEQTLSLPEWIYKSDSDLSDIGLDMGIEEGPSDERAEENAA